LLDGHRHLLAFFVYRDKCREFGEITCKVRRKIISKGMRDMAGILGGAGIDIVLR
jgi:hypothetical protein